MITMKREQVVAKDVVNQMGFMWKHCQLLQDEWENTDFGMDYLNPASNVHGYCMD